jgi:hypothetical protein
MSDQDIIDLLKILCAVGYIIGGGLLGMHLDKVCHIASPPMYWVIGMGTTMMAASILRNIK